MDCEPELDLVQNQIHALYNSPDSSEKEKASSWLGILQHSPYAWSVADKLLQVKLTMESCYFAAQTMRTKVQYSFHELPGYAHQNFRDSLLNHIGLINDQTNAAIVTQLCLAVADLCLQMSTWPSPVDDFLTKFWETNPLPLVEILTVLPEEVNSRHLRLGSNRRTEIMKEFFSSATKVSEYLKLCHNKLGVRNPQVQIKIMKCYSSWLSIQALSIVEATQCEIVASAFQSLSNTETNSQLHDEATECICTLLYGLKTNSHDDELDLQLFNAIKSLERFYHYAVAGEDLDKSINYCRIFTEFCEALTMKMLSNSKEPHFSIQMLNLVLLCTEHHDYEAAEITFNMWYKISEELYQRRDDDLTAMFKPIYEGLIKSLLRHCQLDSDYQGILDCGDDYHDFRARVSDLLKDIVFIVGSSSCFKQMFEYLKQPGIPWESTEAALFVMQAIAKFLSPEESEFVSEVMSSVLMLPEITHVAIKYTSIMLLGELCEWLDKHAQYLDSTINFLLCCLKHKELAPVAANSLQNICGTCRTHVRSSYIESLLQVVESIDNLHLPNDAAVLFIKGVALVVSRLSGDEINQAMKKMCLIQALGLLNIVQNNSPLEAGTKADPVVWLDRLSAIFRHVNPEVKNGSGHPCLNTVVEVWPVLSVTCAKFQTNGKIMEKCCRCIRFIVRCVGKESAFLLEPLVTQLVELYQSNPHSCFLYLGSILIDEYGGEKQYHPQLLAMFEALAVPTFQLLSGENTLKLREHPDAVDDFFRLCTRFLQKAPLVFLQSSIIISVMNCALASVMLDHHDANASVTRFFTDLLHTSTANKESEDYELKNQIVQKLISDNGEALVKNLINSTIFFLPPHWVMDIADVIMELLILDRARVFHWLESCLSALPTQTSGGSPTASKQQLEMFHRTVVNAESSKVITRAIREFSKLFR